MLSSAPCSSSDLAFFSPSKSNKSGTLPIPAVTVTTRLTRRPFPSQPQSRSCTTSSSPSTRSSPASNPPFGRSRKRKSIYPEAPSIPVLSSELPAVKRLRTDAPKEKGSKRKSSSSKNSSRASSHRLSSPEPIYRSERSRSISLFHSNDSVANLPSRRWVTNELGTPGENHLSSEAVVKQLIKSYKAYFTNPDDPKDISFEPHLYPMVELEYPNQGASESFILLAPKDKDHYNPIMDLERTLYTIVECYLSKEQKALFGPIPNFSLSEALSPPPSPSPSPPCSNASDASTSSLSSVSSANSSLTSLSSLHSSSPADRLPVLRAVQRAIHLQHGPLFLKAMQRVNALLRSIKYPSIQHGFLGVPPSNTMLDVVQSWTGHPLPEKVLMRIIEENYQRTVGPNIRSLRCYEAFSSTVYGELLPSFVQEIVQITGLNQDSLFLDLGSGVANVVVQASLQSGCKSYGIELMPHPARVAKEVVEQIGIRSRMWGVRIGKVELEEGDMLQSQRLDELVPKADVVLVDNKVFDESLNEALRPKFLDLKEGACVISLKPFVSTVNARVTRRNVDDISAIFDVEERPYHPGSVSWGNSGGYYYLHRVDRQGYAKIKERFESLHGNSTRSTRSRR